jgi:hypothetical protein
MLALTSRVFGFGEKIVGIVVIGRN